MRSVLRVISVLAVGAALLCAPPARAAEVTWLYVNSFDALLNENGDGYWESATVTVRTDADAAHWSLTSPSGEVVAEADLTDEQLWTRATAGAAPPLPSTPRRPASY